MGALVAPNGPVQQIFPNLIHMENGQAFLVYLFFLGVSVQTAHALCPNHVRRGVFV